MQCNSLEAANDGSQNPLANLKPLARARLEAVHKENKVYAAVRKRYEEGCWVKNLQELNTSDGSFVGL